jgi:phospholipase/carboxylesterase
VNVEAREIGGLHTVVVGADKEAALDVVMLHGFSMSAADLAPSARALGVRAQAFIPDGPLRVEPRGRAWWRSLAETQPAAQRNGPRDLAEEHPEGLAEARAALSRFVAAVRDRDVRRPLVLAGFSQGGMLACDAVIAGDVAADGLALMSSSRIAIDEWSVGREQLRGLPIFVSHGRRDDDLSFAAGEALRDFAADAGARVTWVPFDSGHELPLVVWRELRKFLRQTATEAGHSGSARRW